MEAGPGLGRQHTLTVVTQGLLQNSPGPRACSRSRKSRAKFLADPTNTLRQIIQTSLQFLQQAESHSTASPTRIPLAVGIC